LQDPELKEYEPKLTAFQQYVNAIYSPGFEKCANFANGAPIVVIILGDLTQGTKHPDMFVSDRITDQIAIAEQAMQPIYKLPNLRAVRIAVGTAAHNLGSAATEILISSHLKCQYPEVDTGISYHGLLDVDGALLDYAHHGPVVGARSWLAGNMARFYLRDLMLREIMAHRTPPKIVYRGHVHRSCYEYLKTAEYGSHIFIVPSLAGWGNFTHQVTRSLEEMENGTLMNMVEAGELVKVQENYKRVDLRRAESL
jgi:hypothetical protein